LGLLEETLEFGDIPLLDDLMFLVPFATLVLVILLLLSEDPLAMLALVNPELPFNTCGCGSSEARLKREGWISADISLSSADSSLSLDNGGAVTSSFALDSTVAFDLGGMVIAMFVFGTLIVRKREGPL